MIRRETITPRDNWKQTAKKIGYNYFDNGNGTFAWNESNCYVVSRDTLKDIKMVSEQLHVMCIEVVQKYKNDLEIFQIPSIMRDYVRDSISQPFLIGRFDFAYTSSGLKMIEYNADTPATIPESTRMMKTWIKECVPFRNKFYSYKSILSEKNIVVELLRNRKCASGNTICVVPYPDCVEDKTHAVYWKYYAKVAGWNVIESEIKDLRLDSSGNFISNGNKIDSILKMYPWEFMLREKGNVNLYRNKCIFFNPVWTSMISNKILLAILWKEYRGHPNLIPCYFDNNGMDSYVEKPIHSRGGENIKIIENGLIEQCPGSYGKYDKVYQEKVNTRHIDDCVSTSVGAWIVGKDFSGITFREDISNIIRNDSPIVPHYIG